MDGHADDHPFVGRKQFRQAGMPVQKKAVGTDADDRFRPMPPRETDKFCQFRINRRLTAQEMKFIQENARAPNAHPTIGVRQTHMTAMIVV